MRHLKSYKLFLEEADIDPQITDKPDVKASKEKFGELKNHLIEYKQKKPIIDNLYLKAGTDEDIKSKVDDIMGKENKNPFLVEYLHIASLKRKIDNIQKDITSDKLKKDDFTEEMKLSKEDSIKQAVGAKITDISNRISTKTAEIASLSKEISDAQKALDQKMTNIEKDMMDSIKKLSSKS